MATFSRLKSGSWRAQIRRKGKYVNETFRRRKDAEKWALDIARRIVIAKLSSQPEPFDYAAAMLTQRGAAALAKLA